jgi:hypothetical protein
LASQKQPIEIENQRLKEENLDLEQRLVEKIKLLKGT